MTTATVLADSHLTLHYRLRNAAGEEFVSTYELGPATLQMASGQLSPQLENCLLGLSEGEQRSFFLPAAQAFGERNPRLLERIALHALPANVDAQPNSVIEFTTGEGAQFAGFVREVDEHSALIDFNHPLAGQDLFFDVHVIAVL